MKKLGEHAALIQEVIDFVLDGNVLREPFRSDLYKEYPTHVITSFKGIDRFRDCDRPRSEIGRDISWDGILATDNSFLFEVQSRMASPLFESIVPMIQERAMRIEGHLKKQLRGVVPGKEIRRITGHLDATMMARMLLGPNQSLAEKLFRAFQAFGYPCGWSGDFDESGLLVVYSRA